MSIRRRRKKINNKIILIFVLLIILMLIIKGTLARYTSSGKSEANVEVAFYLLKEEKISQTITLSEIEPNSKIHTYNFSVANNNGIKRTETALKYQITIKTTTNLPLTYELYVDESDENLFEEYVTEKDTDGMFFKTITTGERNFGYKENESNLYTLKIVFPEEYNWVEYQGIIDALEIKINSEQII